MPSCSKCKKAETPAFTKSFRMQNISGHSVEHLRHLCAACTDAFEDDAQRRAFLETTLGHRRRS